MMLCHHHCSASAKSHVISFEYSDVGADTHNIPYLISLHQGREFILSNKNMGLYYSTQDIKSNSDIIEENYTIIRTLLQLRRAKHNDPNRKKNHLGFGFLSHDFFKVLLGPMMESSKKWRRTDEDIKVAVTAWANPATRAAAEITYGHISDWEISQVTNMERLFCGWPNNGGGANMQSFNDDISRWDTSNVTTMDCMFCGAHSF